MDCVPYLYHMKGLTQRLRDLAQGEQIAVYGERRDNIYMIARRVGIRVRVNKSTSGFNVTRVSNLIARNVSEPVEVVTVEDDFNFGA